MGIVIGGVVTTGNNSFFMGPSLIEELNVQIQITFFVDALENSIFHSKNNYLVSKICK